MIISGGIGIFVGIFAMIGLSVFTEAIDVEMSIGVLALALVLLTNIIDFVSGSGFNVKSLLRGVLLPVLFIMGAYQNQKLVA